MVRRNNLSPLAVALSAAVLAAIGTTTVARAAPEGHAAGAHGEQHIAPRAGASCPTHVSKAGNTISHCAASVDPYVPDVTGATPEDRQKAQELFDVVMQFCASHPTTDQLSRNGYRPVRPGATHWVSAHAKPGFNPSAPRAAVVGKHGEVLGVMYGGGRDGFPPLGSIPRPHVHEVGGNEMLHVWCTPDSLEQAFATRNPARARAMAPRSASQAEDVERIPQVQTPAGAAPSHADH